MRPRDYFSTAFAGLCSTIALTAYMGFAPASALAQSEVALDKMNVKAVNRPLHSLREAADRARFNAHKPGPPREVPNYRREGRPLPPHQASLPDAVLQESAGTLATTTIGSGFAGTSNDANDQLFGYLIAPPDTDGQVGPNDRDQSSEPHPFLCYVRAQGEGRACVCPVARRGNFYRPAEARCSGAYAA